MASLSLSGPPVPLFGFSINHRHWRKLFVQLRKSLSGILVQMTARVLDSKHQWAAITSLSELSRG